MDFRTVIDIRPSGLEIDHGKSIFMAGSCFSENIFRKLKDAKFAVAANPTGILFNPLSISEMIAALAAGKRFSREELRTDGDLWFSWAHHGSFADIDAEAALDKMNRAAVEGAAALQNADCVIITFGTAWVYRLTESGEVAANCHKQPADMFRRERLSAADITASYSELLHGALKDKTVIFTLSPVRHLKDGFDGNSLSKAILRAAIGELVENHPNAHYFPAYEIVTDDLRDYRFYAEDMVHPSQQAVDYVWEKFCLWGLSESARSLLPRIEALTRAAAHRTLNPGSDADEKFRAKMRLEVAALMELLPGTDFSTETERFG